MSLKTNMPDLVDHNGATSIEGFFSKQFIRPRFFAENDTNEAYFYESGTA
tara:strand:- start:260 stop:409 length:150 start_codon:yes stop_codon:yes gene_type:complete